MNMPTHSKPQRDSFEIRFDTSHKSGPTQPYWGRSSKEPHVLEFGSSRGFKSRVVGVYVTLQQAHLLKIPSTQNKHQNF